MAVIAKFENVTKSYHINEIQIPVLKNINFEIESEDMVAFVGPSGSGKTTILNLLGCLDKPEKGNIYIEKELINNYNKNTLADLRNQKIGFIFQSFNLIPVLSAYENVEFPLLLENIKNKKQREDMVREILRKVGIEQLKDRLPTHMSGGQQQRVAIARALVKKPIIILADEPTANLDSKTAGEILDLMRHMNESLKTTFVFSTHDPKIMSFAKRLVTLEDGNIVKDERK
ncbi:MAG: ABC transporter [Spirochaetes bacterium GWD1_27_9]|nr:MAG: ABC transporter [Spirochaetes bacterium GWB1_27_13]OHD26215.1 MAG: ABC transporter [Spirochaetes bacterium GWC1_27_15]OHD35563.1 MAG: ABC transporter [Spirochaetes bacterium GWD1_27_9]